MGKKLEDIANKIVDNNNAEISNLINTIHKDIVGDVVNATIPYEVFGAYFLDHFKYGGVMDGEAPLTLKWLELAGGPYNEVDIVDKNGDIIITTPGMFCRPDINDEMSNINFNNIMDEYNLRSNRLHSDGVNYVKHSLNGVSGNVVSEHEKFNFRWEAVFKRYEKKDSKIGAKDKPKINNDDVDFLVFD